LAVLSAVLKVGDLVALMVVHLAVKLAVCLVEMMVGNLAD
jgi:hypothetical protein